MEFIAEIVFEVILEGVFSVTVDNPKVKKWVKTLIFSLMVHAITALLAWGAVSLLRKQDSNGYILAGLAAAWGVGMLIGTICAHRKGWPNNG